MKHFNIAAPTATGAPGAVRRGSVEIDGKCIEDVYRVEVSIGVDQVNRVVLHMYAGSVNIVGEADVTVKRDHPAGAYKPKDSSPEEIGPEAIDTYVPEEGETRSYCHGCDKFESECVCHD